MMAPVRESQVDLMSFPSKVKLGEHVTDERQALLTKQLPVTPTAEELEQAELSNLMDELVKPVG